MSDAATLNDAVRGLLAESADWRLLGLLFEPPSAEWAAEIAALAAEITDPVLAEAAAAARVAVGAGDAGYYHSIFGPGGPAGPREVAYHELSLPGAIISELEGYYAAFGYTPALHEPPDHVAVEAGFVGYLKFKEAFALSRGDDEAAATTAAAACGFVQRHLAMLAEPLAARLVDSAIDYLAAAGRALVARTGPSPRLPQAAPLPLLEDDCDGD